MNKIAAITLIFAILASGAAARPVAQNSRQTLISISK